jgi:transposase
MVIAQGRGLIQRRDEIERLAYANQPSISTTSCCKIPGIDPINTLTILADAGDLRWFKHNRQFLNSAARPLDVSGKHVQRPHEAVQARKCITALASWMAAQVAARCRDNT